MGIEMERLGRLLKSHLEEKNTKGHLNDSKIMDFV